MSVIPFDRDAFIQGLPKAELHLHIEGSLEPELMFALAQRNNITIPFASVEEVRAAYTFSNLQDFLDIYYQGASVLQTEQDFTDLTTAYLDRVAADGVTHVEIFFDPQTHTDRGLPFATAIEGILAGLEQGQRRHGISYGLILCFLRHLSPQAAMETLEAAAPWYDKLLGVGLDSSEQGFPPSLFADVFTAARKRGLKLMAHAGEEGPPAYVWEAINQIGVDRIDHGNRALEDVALVARLAEQGTTLTVCPLSNLSLCVVDDLKMHPLRRMLEAGLKPCINSDDPAYFGGYINANYRAVSEALDLSKQELVALARNSFTGSFLPQADTQRHLDAIDRWAAQF